MSLLSFRDMTFGLDVPDWFFPIIITGLCLGLIYLILHCIIEHAKRDQRRQIKKRRKVQQFAAEECTRLQIPLQIVKEKRVYTVRPIEVEVDHEIDVFNENDNFENGNHTIENEPEIQAI